MKETKILVSQPKPANDKSPYYDIAAKHNATIVFRPFIKVEPLSSRDFRQQKVSIPDFTAVIFTAKSAIDAFFKICEELRITIPDTMKYFCTTEAIALYLQKYIIYRKRKIFFGTTGKLDDPALLAAFNKHNKDNYLYAISDVHTEGGKTPMDDLKINYTKAVLYRTVSNDFTSEEPFDYNVLIFFSPQGIESLIKNFPEFNQDNICIGVFGESTRKAAESAGLRVDFAAPTKETPSMTAALDSFLSSRK